MIKNVPILMPMPGFKLLRDGKDIEMAKEETRSGEVVSCLHA